MNNTLHFAQSIQSALDKYISKYFPNHVKSIIDGSLLKKSKRIISVHDEGILFFDPLLRKFFYISLQTQVYEVIIQDLYLEENATVEEMQWNPMGNLFYIKLSNNPLKLYIVDFRRVIKNSDLEIINCKQVYTLSISIHHIHMEIIQWHPLSPIHLGILANNHFYLYGLQIMEQLFFIPNYFSIKTTTTEPFIQFYFTNQSDVVFVNRSGIIAIVSHIYPNESILNKNQVKVKREWLEKKYIINKSSEMIQIMESNKMEQSKGVRTLQLEQGEYILNCCLLFYETHYGFVYLTNKKEISIGYLSKEEEEDQDDDVTILLDFYPLEKMSFTFAETVDFHFYPSFSTSVFITIPKKGVYQLMTRFLYEIEQMPEKINTSQFIQLYRESEREKWIGYSAWSNIQLGQFYLVGFSENWSFLCLQVQIVPVIVSQIQTNETKTKIPPSEMETLIQNELKKMPNTSTKQTEMNDKQKNTWNHVRNILKGFNSDMVNHFSRVHGLIEQDMQRLQAVMNDTELNQLEEKVEQHTKECMEVTQRWKQFDSKHLQLKAKLEHLSRKLDRQIPLSYEEEDIQEQLQVYHERWIPLVKKQILNLQNALKEKQPIEQEESSLTEIQKQIIQQQLQSVVLLIKGLKQETEQYKKTVL